MRQLFILGLAAIGLPLFALPANAAIYYISSTGLDTNTGTAPNQAWRTLGRANQVQFQPGDRLLLQGGVTFNGTLLFDASDRGAAAAPIFIGSYGAGRATINAGPNSGIYVYNSAGYQIENLKIQGSPSTNPYTAGIAFYTDLAGGVKLDHINISGVETSGFEAAGISIGSFHPTKSGFRNVYINWTKAYNNRDAGIIIYGRFDRLSTGYSHQNVYIGNTKVYNNSGIPNKSNNSGSGILVGDTRYATIEYNEAYENGALNNYTVGGPVGIWTWDSTQVNIQYNKSYRNRTQRFDGGGFDLDGGVTDSIMQYNYSFDNDGAGYLLSQIDGARPFRRNTVRYNVSHNDGRNPASNQGSIQLWNSGSGIFDSRIYNNTIVLGSGSPHTSKAFVSYGGILQAGIYNNIFMTTGNIPIIAVMQPQPTIQFQGNIYWSTDNNFRIDWGAQSYRSYLPWQAVTRQESLHGRLTRRDVDPKLNLSNLPNLLNTSPAIDAGINLNRVYGFSVGNQDYRRQAVPRRLGYDVGAYELP
jgi:hypothetical protein